MQDLGCHIQNLESLRAFYSRTGAQFLEWAISSNRDARGKDLKKLHLICVKIDSGKEEKQFLAEDNLEEMGGVGEVVEKILVKPHPKEDKHI